MEQTIHKVNRCLGKLQNLFSDIAKIAASKETRATSPTETIEFVSTAGAAAIDAEAIATIVEEPVKKLKAKRKRAVTATETSAISRASPLIDSIDDDGAGSSKRKKTKTLRDGVPSKKIKPSKIKEAEESDDSSTVLADGSIALNASERPKKTKAVDAELVKQLLAPKIPIDLHIKCNHQYINVAAQTKRGDEIETNTLVCKLCNRKK